MGEDMTTSICEQCGKEYKTNWCWLKRQKHHFCSKLCANKYRSINLVGKNNPNYKGSFRETNCKNCGKSFGFYISERLFRPTLFCSRKCVDDWRNKNNLYGFKLEKHWNWQGGKSFELYPIEFSKMREFIREKYKRICQLCGKAEGKRKLDVHHIDYNKKHCEKSNLIPLCLSCHIKTNVRRKYWQAFFEKMGVA